MPELQAPEEGSILSGPQVMKRAAARASQPYPLVNRIALGIVTALLAVGLVVGVLIWGVGPGPLEFRPAPSFSIAQLSCVSVEDVKYDAKEFSDPNLVDAVADILRINTVLFNADYEACPWGLVLGVAPEPEPTARRDGSAAYLVSSRICARRTDGTMKPNDCVSRDTRIVTSRPVPHELFTMGLLALTLRQIGVSP